MKQEVQASNDANQQEILKKYLKAANLVGHLTDAEVDQFIQISTAFGLNPFKREIYASKYGNNFSIVVGYETYIKRAERSGKLDGWKVITEGGVNYSKPQESALKATITIHRKDFKLPFVHEVFFSEYCQRTKQGQLTRFWREKPITMIKKVAISQGFRLCFSDELGGIPYTKEEIGSETIDQEAIVVEPVSNKEIEQPDPVKEEIKIEIQFQEAEKMLEDCQNRDDCVKVWKGFPDLQTEEDFIQLIKQKTIDLQKSDLKTSSSDSDKEDLEEKKTPQIEEDPVVIGKTDGLLFKESNDYSAEEAIQLIKEMKSENEVIQFTLNDARKTVIEYAKKKIDKLNENE